MSNPLVTIVTPSYNQAEFLEETLRSVLDQDYEPIEYIVVDDGSSDGSTRIIDRHADRLASATFRPNGGQASAINQGFAQSTGDLLAYVNSDDTLLPGALSELVAAFTADPELLLVYGDALYTNASSEVTGYLESRPFDVAAMVAACDNHVVQPSTLWRREAWERFGPFDENGWYFFDFQFFLRFPPQRVLRIPKPFSTYRVHERAKSSGGRSLAKDHARLAEEFFASERLPAAARPVARRGRASAYLLGGEFAYEALDLQTARIHLLRGLSLDPKRVLQPRWVSLLAKTLLPARVVRALRARRRSS